MPRSTVLAFLLLAAAPTLTSCVAAAAAGVVGVGVGLVQYQRNEATRDFPTTLETTWQACLQACLEQGLEVLDENLGVTEGELEGEGLFVRAEVHAEGFTRVRIRFGTFASSEHRRRADLLMQAVERALEQSDGLRDWTEKVRKLSRPRQPESP
jgi:hypothetical protein